jgi:GTPase SAR1 family protein
MLKYKNIYCQIVLGIPGSGKTTFCNVIDDFVSKTGRNSGIINMDPGCYQKNIIFKANICDIIHMNEIISDLHLGPNGSILYCLEYLYKNLGWLEKKINLISSDSKPIFIFFDFPGQIELYTHRKTIKNIITRMQKQKINLNGIIITDYFFLADHTVNCLLSLTNLMIMLNIELPFINLLNKLNLLNKKVKKTVFFNIVDNSSVFLQNLDIQKNSFNWSFKILKNLQNLTEDFIQTGPFPFDFNSSSDLEKILKKVVGGDFSFQ